MIKWSKIDGNALKSFVPPCHISQTILNGRMAPFKIIGMVVDNGSAHQQGDFTIKSPCWLPKKPKGEEGKTLFT
jgi:hypothetical protein